MTCVRVGIIGATGYAAVELLRLLLEHPAAEVTCLVSETKAGEPVSAAYPHLAGFGLPELQEYDPARMAAACDIVFAARGNGWAMSAAGELLARGVRIIDLAADFRLRDTAEWKYYYGSDHAAPDLLAEAVYGLPEIHADDIAGARIVANPGCYSTCAILALAPAVAAGLVSAEGICIASASGTSGAGRSRAETAYLFSEINENYRAYNVTKHRHTGEIDQELSALGASEISVTFTPHLAPMTRGIHTTAYARAKEGMDQTAVTEAYKAYFNNAPFVRVLEPAELPQTKQALGSNRCYISPVLCERTQMMVVTAVIDNLVKGAAGQAVQNMNLMAGLDGTCGLLKPAVYP